MNYDNFINLNCNSLETMFINSYATNLDESVNIKYTLSGIKEKLLNDIKVIDKLLSVTKNIESIEYQNENIGININNNDLKQKLLESNIITDLSHADEDYNIYNVIDESSSTKLNKILQLTSLDNNDSDNEDFKLIYDEKSFRDLQSHYQVDDIESSHYSSDSDFDD